MRRPIQTFHTPLRATWDVAGDPTETVWWPPQQDSVPKTILFFIPGNPGLVEYYTDFLETIYRAASPSLEIYGVSHLGHSTGPHTKYQKDPDRLYSLHEQIQHKIRCFDILRSENAADTKFILMGHSIGAYICAEVLKKRQDQGIERLIALFPTLREIALTPNGVSISRLISTLPKSILPTAASGLSLLADPVRQRLVGLFTGQSGSSLQVTAHQLLRASVVRNALYMAQHEMETVKELDHDFYDAHVDKFVLYYSKNDEWAPLDHYDYMKAKFPNHQHIYLCEQNLPHAFILDHKHADYMAKKVVAWISA